MAWTLKKMSAELERSGKARGTARKLANLRTPRAERHVHGRGESGLERGPRGYAGYTRQVLNTDEGRRIAKQLSDAMNK